MDDQQDFPIDSASPDEGPFADHPELSSLSREVRLRIADELARGRLLGAVKTLLDAKGPKSMRIQQAREIIEGLELREASAQSEGQTWTVKLASGKIDKGGTLLTLYQDGTFTTKGLFATSDPDHLLAFSTDSDSMRRKSVTGRGAAAILTQGISLAGANNRGVAYVTVTGQRSGVKTYTTRNPSDAMLSTIRSLQAAADILLATPTDGAAATASAGAAATQPGSDLATQLATLAELRASGALTDDEFVAAKSRLLS